MSFHHLPVILRKKGPFQNTTNGMIPHFFLFFRKIISTIVIKLTIPAGGRKQDAHSAGQLVLRQTLVASGWRSGLSHHHRPQKPSLAACPGRSHLPGLEVAPAERLCHRLEQTGLCADALAARR